jgi:hypothetical protein
MFRRSISGAKAIYMYVDCMVSKSILISRMQDFLRIQKDSLI